MGGSSLRIISESIIHILIGGNALEEMGDWEEWRRRRSRRWWRRRGSPRRVGRKWREIIGVGPEDFGDLEGRVPAHLAGGH